MACGNPVYILLGYREDDMKFDNEVKFKDWVFDNHDTHTCELPYDACKHDIFCISDELHDELKKQEDPVNLIGLSFGGNVAQAYAIKHPKKLNKMALISSTDLKRVNSLMKSALKLKHFDNARSVNYEEMQMEINTPTFIYNCFIDRIFGGNPPKIKGADVEEDLFCLHGVVKPSIKGRVERFFQKS